MNRFAFPFLSAATLVNCLCGAALLGAFAVPALAQEIKVDINNSGRPVSEGNDPAYTAWSTNTTWYSGGSTISNTFSGVTVSFSVVNPPGAPFRAGYWKDGVQKSPPSGTAYNCKLAGDGIKVHEDNGGNNGGQIEMRLSGLSPGPHTVMTYHNTWETGASNALINVFLNGTQVLTNLATTFNVTNTYEARVAYLDVEAVAGQDVVIRFAPSAATTAPITNIYINGFEIDTPNSTLKAVAPIPFNEDTHADADNRSILLGWTKAGSAVSHDVYFGSSSNAVRNATRVSPEFKGNQTATNYFVTNISSLVTYYWRVDEINAASVTTKGDLWMFRPRHLAFPGAEGYGRFARGGRGGVVVKVTNLNNSGPGSFREAIEGNYGPRTVVFDVSGQLVLSDDIIISGAQPFITVAGQTAPGKGICIRRQQFGVSGADDVIIRFMRMRVGKESGETQNGSGLAGVNHAIIDHCSISWGIDEEISTRGAKNVTLQRTLISEALNIAGHDKYPAGTKHGYAATISGRIGSYHHNLLAHNEGRNWSIGDEIDGSGTYASQMDIFNNVVYNWGGRTTDGTAHNLNFVNNYYKPGPASTKFVALTAQLSGFNGTQEFYFAGNVMPGYFDLSNQTAGRTSTGTVGYNIWAVAPFFPSYAVIDEVTNAYKRVLSDVGCNQPRIDDHDTRVIRETIAGTYTYTGSVSGKPGLPDTTDDVGGWEDYGNEVRPAGWDTDNDGMPNWWEQIKGLNPNVADHNGDPDGDEYVNLEDYLNWLALPHFDCTNGTPIDIDLTQFTSGFTNNSPVYFVNLPTNGTVALVGNNRTARFTSTVSSNALGSFRFAVVDAQGYNLTNTMNLRLIAAPAQPPVLGLRNQAGALMLELTGENGRNHTVQTKTNLAEAWVNWTNLNGSGALQLLHLNSLTNQSPRYFRALVP